VPRDARAEGDYTATLPTRVSNEEAIEGQREWDDYYKQIEEQRKKAVRSTGGGCVATVIGMLVMAFGILAGVM